MLAQRTIASPQEPKVDAGLMENMATARKLPTEISRMEFHQADRTLKPLLTFTCYCAKTRFRQAGFAPGKDLAT